MGGSGLAKRNSTRCPQQAKISCKISRTIDNKISNITIISMALDIFLNISVARDSVSQRDVQVPQFLIV